MSEIMVMERGKRGEVRKQRRIRCRRPRIRTTPVLDTCAHCLTSFSLLQRNNVRNKQEVSMSQVTSCDNTTLPRQIPRTKQNK